MATITSFIVRKSYELKGHYYKYLEIMKTSDITLIYKLGLDQSRVSKFE